MRAVVLILLLVPVAHAAHGADARDVVADQVYPTHCPTYATPASVGCFSPPAGSATARIVADPDVGDAQPRMLVWAYDGSRLVGTWWLCDDATVGLSGADLLVVTLHPDREGCSPRLAVIVHGTLGVTYG